VTVNWMPMPALLPTKFKGRITWLGLVPDRSSSLKSSKLAEAFASFSGFEGEAHAGLTRPSDSRVLSQHPRDTEIRNVRQFSIVSSEDLDAVAKTMRLERVPPEWLGASIEIEGIPDFTHIPPSSRLQTQTGTTLVVDMENRPCNLVAKVIEDEAPGFGKAFKAAAHGRRGVTAWVEREGVLRVGDTVTLHVPDQPAWRHLGAARNQE
jgi:hypothetical protein